MEKNIKFPQGFLLGASTSAYQIEGGIINDWSQWETSEKRLAYLKKQGLNPEDFICAQACDSYNKWEEDFELIKKLNLNSYRFSLEWARIEPREGEFNQEAIEYYRKILTDLKKAGIKNIITLWHWTNPVWIADIGGWANKKTASHYSNYVNYVCQELGDLVDYWTTLNEPTVHFSNGYIKGNFPPNKRNIFSAIGVFKNLMSAHKSAYKIIHSHQKGAQVSLTHLYNYHEPARRWCLPEVVFAWVRDFFNNKILLNTLKNHLDFIGIDYYFHSRVVWYPPFVKNLNKEVNDLGWEIYPKGLHDILLGLRRYKKPVIVVENGLADASDLKRKKFIIDHLAAVRQAMNEGVDVRGYLHWSLLDNFEWAHGWAPKFGLASVNRETGERIVKPSGRFYAEVCKNGFIEKYSK